MTLGVRVTDSAFYQAGTRDISKASRVSLAIASPRCIMTLKLEEFKTNIFVTFRFVTIRHEHTHGLYRVVVGKNRAVTRHSLYQSACKPLHK